MLILLKEIRSTYIKSETKILLQQNPKTSNNDNSDGREGKVFGLFFIAVIIIIKKYYSLIQRKKKVKYARSYLICSRGLLVKVKGS